MTLLYTKIGGISVIVSNHLMSEIGVVVLDKDRFAFGLSGYPVIPISNCVD